MRWILVVRKWTEGSLRDQREWNLKEWIFIKITQICQKNNNHQSYFKESDNFQYIDIFTKYLGSSIVTEVLPWQYTSCHLLFSLLWPVLRNSHTLTIWMTYINSYPLEKTMVRQYQQKFQLMHLQLLLIQNSKPQMFSRIKKYWETNVKQKCEKIEMSS